MYWYQDVSFGNGVQIFNTWGGNPYSIGTPADINFSAATNISFWIKWDTANSTLGINSFNDQDYATPSGWGQDGIVVGIQTVSAGGEGTVIGTALIPIAASNGWVQVNVPIGTGVIPNPNQAVGLSLFKWSNTTSASSGIFAFWIDDIQAEYPGAPPPPPILSMTPAAGQGLNIYDDGNAYDRQNIETVVTNAASPYNYSWIDSASPVTYSVSIAQGPVASYTNYQVQVMLFPGTNITESDPDWAEADAVILFLERHTNGVIAQLRYKLNDGNANDYLYGSNTNIFGPNPGQPLTNTIVAGYGGLLCAATNVNGFAGTWSFTISPGGNITLTGPPGTAPGTGAFPAGDAAAFAGPLTAFWGTQPNIGGYYQDVVLSSVAITGSANTLNVDLTQPLDPAKMVVRASNSGLIFATPTNAAYWLQWTLPDAGFVLTAASSLKGPWAEVIGSTTPITNFANPFNTSGSFQNGRNYNPPPMGVGYDFGDDSSPTIAWAAGPTYDAAGSAASGSLEFSWAFAGGSGNEAFTMDLFPSGQNFSGATLSFDIMIDPVSTPGTNADYGYLNVIARDGNYDWNVTSLGEGLLTAAGGTVGKWGHVSIPLGTGADSVIRGLTFQISNDGGINGPEIFYIDNLEIVNSTPLPPTTRYLGAIHGTFVTTPMLPSNSAGFFRLANP